MDSNNHNKSNLSHHQQRLNNNHSNDVLVFTSDHLEFNDINNDDDKSTIYKHEFNSTRKEILDYRELVFTLRCIKPFNLKVSNYKKKKRIHYGSRLLLHHHHYSTTDNNSHYVTNDSNRRRHSNNSLLNTQISTRDQITNLTTRSASFSASSSIPLNQDTMNPFNSLGDTDFKRHLYGLVGSSSLGDIYDSSSFDSCNIPIPIPMISESQQNQRGSIPFTSSTSSTNSTQTTQTTTTTVSNILTSYSMSSTTNRRRKSSIVSNYNNSNRKNSTFSISNSINSISTSINSNNNTEINLHKQF
ncbi:unnamed protein product [[Candida] boidinii]|uniref:Unnamed protein product n=1 Tax=Candida boidinii TaxID=5477 RepID=A0ACB5U7K9_CANBO|nr:unnamed protein product [[Candida] boidinii]